MASLQPTVAWETPPVAEVSVGAEGGGVPASCGLSAGPVPLGVRAESLVSRILSAWTPSSRIHRLMVATPALATLMVRRVVPTTVFFQARVVPLVKPWAPELTR